MDEVIDLNEDVVKTNESIVNVFNAFHPISEFKRLPVLLFVP